MRKTSQAGLLLLVERGIIAPSQVEENVCPVILEYTGPPAHEDYRTEIAQVCKLMQSTIMFNLCMLQGYLFFISESKVL